MFCCLISSLRRRCDRFFVIIATRPLTTTYQCGPFCPPENVTMKSCVTLCSEEEIEEGENGETDAFRITVLAEANQGRFRDGTPCLIEDDEVLERDGEVGEQVGMCCGGNCLEIKDGQNPCKSMMRKCQFEKEVRLNLTILRKQWESRRRRSKRN
ncbi:uncharacterized protein LOC142767411 isoform X1 [Rhipicephalus microplus]|uniref:uncharacterized protein LOC142767411 isoform X1 n=1 Tax=Rhipicephalus microplus TaxID=6941 RepID=UPI003F6CCCB7